MNLRSFIIIFALLLGALIGWLMLEDATQVAENRKEIKERKLTFITHEPSRPKKTRTRDLSKKPFTLEDMIALPNQKLIRFKDEKSYRDFRTPRTATQSGLQATPNEPRTPKT